MTAEKSPTFHVGELPIYGETILSPMDGVSDWPFRSLCRRLGSAMSYTEFVRAEAILQEKKSVFKKLTYEESERPVVFQIYGDNPDKIVEAALRIQHLGPDVIDLNMGCPSRSIANRGAGVGMMRTPLKIGTTFRKLTAALDIPVTGKMRLGWDGCRTYKMVARMVEENGGALIALHGRTRVRGALCRRFALVKARFGAKAHGKYPGILRRGLRKPLVRQAKLGVSCRVKVPVEQGLTSHSYRVLQ